MTLLDRAGNYQEGLGKVKWQPIELAPKDGTEMLLFYPAFFQDEEANVVMQGYWLCCNLDGSPNEDDGWYATNVGFGGEPSHWMPLPQQPKSA